MKFKRVFCTREEMKSIIHKQGKEGVLRWLKDWDFIKNGVDSGYHPCCIAHFKIRSLFLSLHEWAFGHIGIFDTNKHARSWYEHQKEEMETYLNSTWYKVRHPGYVCCLFHTARLRITKRPYEWYRCPNCKWNQIRFKECRRCTTSRT